MSRRARERSEAAMQANPGGLAGSAAARGTQTNAVAAGRQRQQWRRARAVQLQLLAQGSDGAAAEGVVVEKAAGAGGSEVRYADAWLDRETPAGIKGSCPDCRDTATMGCAAGEQCGADGAAASACSEPCLR